MRAAHAVAVAGAVLALTACELTRSPTAITLTEDRVMVQSVVLAGDSTARVLIRLIPAKADPFNPFAVPEWIPIADAAVRFVADGDTILMTPRLNAATNPCMTGAVAEQSPAGELLPGCYVGSVPGGIVSGSSYDLIIDLPGRGRVQGRTLVPEPPVIIAPAAGALLQTNGTQPGVPAPIDIEWSGSMPDRRAELGLATNDQLCAAYIKGGAGFLGLSWLPVQGQSSAEIEINVECSTLTAEVPGEIVLTTFDNAYSRYARAIVENHLMEDAVAGFTGPAIGVYGSAAAARQPVRFAPQ